MPDPTATRRRVLAGVPTLGAAVGVAVGTAGLLGGCSPPAAPSTVPPPADDAGLAADRALLDGLRTDLAAVAAVVRARLARPGLPAAERRAMTSLRRLHRAQADALGAPRDVLPAGAAGVPTAPGATAVPLAEERWERRLTTAAVAAAEPRLAVLLGALAAGTAQHRALLPTPDGGAS